MRIYDLIVKKRDGHALTKEEISFLIKAYVKGTVQDYQMSAFLMALFIKGMDSRETAELTDVMAHSGDMIDLSPIEGITVDKHSTGGVGDKTTFIVGPIVAACGGKVAKMSGRGLGHTGGTIDKMEAIPHIQSSLEEKEFFRIVNEIGISVIGQSNELAPADKKLYALRDVTGTVDSIPLIASSIMSKKLASGSDAIVLDVKVGSGAFMKTLPEAVALAREMINIGTYHGRSMVALITDMDRPLGYTIGNALEIKEVIQTLQNDGPEDLVNECIALAANMLHASHMGTIEECTTMAEEALHSGKAYKKFVAMVQAQGGDTSYLVDRDYPTTTYSQSVVAHSDGYIQHMNTEQCGIAALVLGAGREKKEDILDYDAGIIMFKKTGDSVKTGEVIAKLQTNRDGVIDEACAIYERAIKIGAAPPHQEASIKARITKEEEVFYVSYDEPKGMAMQPCEENYVDTDFNSTADSSTLGGLSEPKGQFRTSEKNQERTLTTSYSREELLDMAGMDEITARWLVDRAITARQKAYAEYSNFSVGAALLEKDGSLYVGCNVENASYGLTNCAERTAIFAAMADGKKNFKALAVVADTAEPCAPCGACRQVIAEFNIPIIIMANLKKEMHIVRKEDLLPYHFSASSMSCKQ